MTFWRHPMLRELNRTKQRRRFKTLLAMRAPASANMCSECEAPSQWHEYALSLCLFRPDPPAGSTAERLANLLPGWWRRCWASAAYQLEHRWGGKCALPDFTGEQWRAMLTPLLREIFAPDPPKARKALPRREPLAVIPAGTIDSVLPDSPRPRPSSPTPKYAADHAADGKCGPNLDLFLVLRWCRSMRRTLVWLHVQVVKRAPVKVDNAGVRRTWATTAGPVRSFRPRWAPGHASRSPPGGRSTASTTTGDRGSSGIAGPRVTGRCMAAVDLHHDQVAAAGAVAGDQPWQQARRVERGQRL